DAARDVGLQGNRPSTRRTGVVQAALDGARAPLERLRDGRCGHRPRGETGPRNERAARVFPELRVGRELRIRDRPIDEIRRAHVAIPRRVDRIEVCVHLARENVGKAERHLLLIRGDATLFEWSRDGHTVPSRYPISNAKSPPIRPASSRTTLTPVPRKTSTA